MARVVRHGALHGEAVEGTQREANFIVLSDRHASLLPLLRLLDVPFEQIHQVPPLAGQPTLFDAG